MCSSQTSQTTSIPGASAQEIRLQELFEQAILPQMIEESGYHFEREDQDTVTRAAVAAAERQSRNRMGVQVKSPDQVMVTTEGGKQVTLTEARRLVELPRGVKYTMRKKYSPEIEKIREEFGEDSPEFKDAVAGQEGVKQEAEQRQGDLMKRFQENSMKFLSGDFSMNAAQKASMEEMFAPARQAFEKMYSDIGAEVDDFEKQVDAFDEKITSFREGKEKVDRELLAQGIKEFGDDVSLKIMNDAVASGRDPADPEFVAEIGQMVAKEAARGSLALESEQIASRERQSRDVMGMRGDIFNRRLGVAEGRGVANIGIEEQARNLRMGSLTGGGGMAMQSSQLVDAINQQRIANLGGVNSMIQNEANALRGLRGMQATTNQTSTPSPLSTMLGIGTAAASIYSGGAAAGMYSAQAARLRSQANSGGSVVDAGFDPSKYGGIA